LGLAVKLTVFLLASCALQAQDVRTVASPNGQLEFRIFVGQPKDSGLSRLAYQVFYRGKRILDTSYLGIDIYPQEPLLGQYIGLINSSVDKASGYNQLRANYMQNGSLGRLVDIEARISDSEIRFRYVVPKSTPLIEPFTIDEEDTEFAVEPDAKSMVKIGEDNTTGSYPPMTLVKGDDSVLLTHLARKFEATTPLTTPWRVITVTGDSPRKTAGQTKPRG
jgi:hypothetical protein